MQQGQDNSRHGFEGFTWEGEGASSSSTNCEFWQLSADKNQLTIEPKGETDFYNGFYKGAPLQRTNAPLFVTSTPIRGDFTFSCRVDARLVGFGDAGAMTVWVSKDRWAKLCLERSPIGEVAIVSVVTNGFSDDANSELLVGRHGKRRRRGSSEEVVECVAASCELRISRNGNEFGMQYRVVDDSLTTKYRVEKESGLENEEQLESNEAGEAHNQNKWRFVRSFIAEWMGAEVRLGVHAQAPFVGGCSVLFRNGRLLPTPVADLRSGE
jgi:regulation of enolase protein 1 (concanavalin A-like superfamily)